MIKKMKKYWLNTQNSNKESESERIFKNKKKSSSSELPEITIIKHMKHKLLLKKSIKFLEKTMRQIKHKIKIKNFKSRSIKNGIRNMKNYYKLCY